MLQSEHNKGMRDFDSKIEEIKKPISERILCMKLCDVLNLKSFSDNCIEEKITNLNVTIKETVQKADEGKIFLLLSVFLVSLSSFALFLICPPPFISIPMHDAQKLKGTLQKSAVWSPLRPSVKCGHDQFTRTCRSSAH